MVSNSIAALEQTHYLLSIIQTYLLYSIYQIILHVSSFFLRSGKDGFQLSVDIFLLTIGP